MAESLGKQIRIIRSSRGWTQADLAERAGVSLSVICVLEVGKNQNPRISTLWRIANALGVSLAELLKTTSFDSIDRE